MKVTVTNDVFVEEVTKEVGDGMVCALNLVGARFLLRNSRSNMLAVANLGIR